MKSKEYLIGRTFRDKYHWQIYEIMDHTCIRARTLGEYETEYKLFLLKELKELNVDLSNPDEELFD